MEVNLNLNTRVNKYRYYVWNNYNYFIPHVG